MNVLRGEKEFERIIEIELSFKERTSDIKLFLESNLQYIKCTLAADQLNEDYDLRREEQLQHKLKLYKQQDKFRRLDGEYNCSSKCISGYCERDGDCKKCQAGYYGDYCRQCQTNCSECTSSTCKKCFDGYYLISNSCRNCISNCKICLSAGTCQECKDGFFKQSSGLCEASCPSTGFYKNISNKTCEPCQNGCQTCSSGPSTCQTCLPNYVKTTSGCILCATNNKQYIDSNNLCQNCHSSCQTCNGSTEYKCQSCVDSSRMLNEQNQCIICDLSQGYFISNNICKKCDLNCLSCSSTATACSACPTSLSLYNGTCVNCSLKQGFYITPSNECLPCHSSCKSCTSALDKNCITCKDNLYFQPDQTCKTCVVSQGWYILNDKCLKCHSSCQTCSGGNAEENCTLCKSGSYWNERNGIQKGYCGLCDTKSGYYISGEFCNKCDSSCQECALVNSLLKCLKCKSGLFFQNGDYSKCVQCPSQHFYTKESTQECLQCDSSCQECSDGTDTGCLTCNTSYYRNEQTKKCVLCNQPGEIKDSNFCYNCEGNCNTCSIQNLSQCLTCLPNNVIHSTFQTCVPCNQPQEYVDPIDNKCKQCHNTCNTCHGPSEIDCITCISGLSLDANNICIECPTQKFFVESNQCKQCHISCLTCNNSSSCLTCPNNNSVQLDQLCPFQCSSGQYYDTVSNQCEACHHSCSECTQKNNTDCITCASGLHFTQQGSDKLCQTCQVTNKQYIEGYKCLDCENSCQSCNGPTSNNCLSCPSNGTYLTINGTCSPCNLPGYFISNQDCLKCSSNCKTCTGVNLTDCTECLDNLKTFHEVTHECIVCPTENYFVENKICKRCHQDCLTCSGAGSNQCIKCKNNLFNINNKCLTCPTDNAFYEDKVNNLCNICDSSCKTCSNSTNLDCITCQNGMHFFSDNRCDVCVTSNKQYISLDKCLDCHPSCQTCLGSTDLDCLTCVNGLHFLEGKCQVCDITNKHYINGIYCIKCHNDCQTCNGHEQKDCLSCATPNHYHNGDTNICQICDTTSGYFLSSNQICQKCHSSCKSCTGPLNTECTACILPKLLLPDNSCGNCIDDRFVNVNGQCKECDLSCQKCSGITDTDCTKCQPGHGLDENSHKCILCPLQGHYIDPNTGVCKSCNTDCETCTDINNTYDYTCKKCNTGFYINEQTLQCGSCGQGYYIDNNYCRKCNEACKICSAGTQNDCISCSDNYKKRPDHSCQICSDEYQYFDAIDQICYDCPLNCFKCNSKKSCLDCQKGYYKDEMTGQCVDCNENNGYFKSGEYCKKCDLSCKTCSNTFDNCLTCQDKLFMRPNSTKCSPCPQDEGYFVDKNNKCLLCYNLKGFQYNPSTQKCEEICGKGFVNQEDIRNYPFAVSNIQCDDGNLLRYDGCSNTCVIEKGYECKNVKKQNNDIKTECKKVRSGAIPKLRISPDITQIDDIFLIKGFIKFDRDVKVLDYKQWQVEIFDQLNQQFLNFTYVIIPVKNETNILQEQTFQVSLRLSQNITGMNLQLRFPELGDIIDQEELNLSNNQVKGQLPDIKITSKKEEEQLIYFQEQSSSQQSSESSQIISIALQILMLLFFASGQLYYLVHFYDLLQIAHYLIYLNISYPYFLNQILHIIGFANFESIPNINSNESNAPQKFKILKIDTLLFSNIVQLISIWGFSLFVYFIARLFVNGGDQQKNIITKYLKLYRDNYVFNIIIGLGLITFQEFLLASLLQIYDSGQNNSIKGICANIIAFIFMLLCGILIYSILNKNLLQVKNGFNTQFYQWKLRNNKNLLYISMVIRKALTILIIVYGKAGISQCLTIHLFIGIETVIIIIQKPFKQIIEYRMQVFKRAMLLIIISLITLITYSDDENKNNLIEKSKNDLLSILTSVCLIVFLLSHLLYFFRQIYVGCLSQTKSPNSFKQIQ